MKQTKRPFAVEVEHPQIVSLLEVSHHDVEMSAVSLFGGLHGDFVGNELVDPLRSQLPQQHWILERGVRREDDQRSTSGKQQGGFHGGFLTRRLASPQGGRVSAPKITRSHCVRSTEPRLLAGRRSRSGRSATQQ